MTTEASNVRRPRRNEEMKFAYAGPFARLLNPIRPVAPARDKAGNVLDKQPRYTPTAPESWTIGARLGAYTAAALEATFGREYGSVLDDEQPAPAAPRKRRRRGSRGGRKPVAS